MMTTTYRTTFALDEATARRLSRLSATWRVSRAEVVRRAVAMADEGAERPVDAAALLHNLHHSGRAMVRETADGYLADVRSARHRSLRRRASP